MKAAFFACYNVEVRDPSMSRTEQVLTNSAVGFPRMLWSGHEGHYNVMILDRLGPTLEDLFNYCGRKFSLKTVLMIADQAVRFPFIRLYRPKKFPNSND